MKVFILVVSLLLVQCSHQKSLEREGGEEVSPQVAEEGLEVVDTDTPADRSLVWNMDRRKKIKKRRHH